MSGIDFMLFGQRLTMRYDANLYFIRKTYKAEEEFEL